MAWVPSAMCASAAVEGDSPTIGALKQLNVEDLMNVEVTSVARHPEKLLQAASAIQVITQEDIRRSGATSIPEALRLADNLQVAQKNSHDWAISARGFNTDLANKLLVMIDGRTVYTPLYSGVFWDVQDYLLEDIDRIMGRQCSQWGDQHHHQERQGHSRGLCGSGRRIAAARFHGCALRSVAGRQFSVPSVRQVLRSKRGGARQR
jgi:outer membrane cobalamin receptor